MDRRLALVGLALLGAVPVVAEEALGPPVDSPAVAPGPEPGAALAELPELDLFECLAQALAHNPEIGISHEAIERARGQRRTANGALGPSLEFTYSEVWQQQTSVQLDPAGPPINITPGNTRQFVLNSTWVLYAGGALRANQAIARLTQAAAEHQLTATVNAVVSQTVAAYLNLLRAQELKTVADETVTLAGRQVDDANFSFEAGAVARVDLLRAEAALQNALQAQLSSGNGIALARAALNRQMGRSQLAPVRIKSMPIALAAVPDLLDSLRAAVRQRPELRAQQKLIDINEEAVRAARADYFPTVSVNTQLTRNPNVGAFGNPDNFNVVFAFRLKLWDWQQTAGRVRSAQADVERERRVLERSMQEIELQVRQAVLRLDEAGQRINVAEAEVAAARAAHDIERLRYTTGEGTYLEFLDARRSFSQAQANLVTALYDYALAQADWLAATGGYVAGDELNLPQGQRMPLPTEYEGEGVEFDDLLARYPLPAEPARR